MANIINKPKSGEDDKRYFIIEAYNDLRDYSLLKCMWFLFLEVKIKHKNYVKIKNVEL